MPAVEPLRPPNNTRENGSDVEQFGRLILAGLPRSGTTLVATLLAAQPQIHFLTDYFPAAKQWMINFRVDDIDELISQLKTAGIAVETRAEWDTPETGRFARIVDPEGNQVELWQPPAD